MTYGRAPLSTPVSGGCRHLKALAAQGISALSTPVSGERH
jgi:hypothetical protein